jgi:hypothetical protein
MSELDDQVIDPASPQPRGVQITESIKRKMTASAERKAKAHEEWLATEEGKAWAAAAEAKFAASQAAVGAAVPKSGEGK